MDTIVHVDFAVRGDQASLSPEEFRAQARDLLGEVNSLRCDIANIQQFFAHTPLIRPVECDTAVLTLQRLRLPLHHLRHLLDIPSLLPREVLPYRYDLIAPLFFADAQVQKQQVYLKLFRPVCLDRAPHVMEQRQAIASTLSNLIDTCVEIEHQGRLLLDRSYW